MNRRIPVIGCAGFCWILCLVSWGLCAGTAAGQNTSVVVWGDNTFGETNVPYLSDPVEIATTISSESCLVLQADGMVVGWGDDADGQTDIPPNLTNAVAIAAGGSFTLALKADGTLVGWGLDAYGVTDIPSSLSNVVAVAAGQTVGMALRNDGSVVVWGNPYTGQTNVPANLSNVVAMAASDTYCLALSANGQVTAWGEFTNTPPGLTNGVSIAAGDDFCLATTSDSTLVAWGDFVSNSPSGLINLTNFLANLNDLTDVVAVAASEVEALLLNQNGTIVAAGSGEYGDNGSGVTNIPTGLTNVMAVAIGDSDGMAITGSQIPAVLPMASEFAYSGATTLVLEANALGGFPLSYQWRFNGTNIPGSNQPWLVLTNVQTVNSGNFTVVVSNAFGTASNTVPLVVANSAPVILQQPQPLELPPDNNFTFSVDAAGSQPMCYQWQFNGTNIPGATGPSFTVTNAQLSEAGYYGVVLGNSYGTLVSSNAGLSFSITSVAVWGDNSEGQLNVYSNLTDVLAVSAGAFDSLALLADGTVEGWGDDTYGEIDVPAEVTNVTAIAAGAFHNLELLADGTVVGWGDDSYGDIDVPAGLCNVVSIAAGGYASMALQGNGIVTVWGYPEETNVPESVSNVVAIGATSFDCLALRSNGTVVEWGNDDYGQIEFASTLTNIIAIGSGAYAFANTAVKADGTAVIWGYVPSYLDVPPGLSNVVAVAAGESFCLAMLADRTAVVWGENDYNVLNLPPGLTNVTGISCGDRGGLILDPAGGVITLVPSGISGQSQVGYLQATLTPLAAVSAGGGWGIVGQPYFSSSTNFTVAVSAGQSVALAFQSVNGWNVPNSEAVTVPIGGLTNINISYAVTPPVMSIIPGVGIGLAGTTNTTYTIQSRTNLSAGNWLTLSTNTLHQGFNKFASWPPTNHAPAAFYRATWLGY